MTRITATLLALWLVFGATTHAHALPIGLAIAGALGFVGTAATIVGAAITLAIGVGLQLVAGALLRKRGSADVGGTTGKMQTGGVVPRSFPFGDKAVVSHSLTYWNSFGQEGKTPNAYVAFEFALSDLPVGGGRAALRDLWVNSSLATWDPEATPGTYGIAIPEFNKDGRDHMWVEVWDGTQTEADAFLVSKFATDPDRPYAATRVFTGIVKVRVICRLNRDLFSGYPSFKFVVAGVPLYDLREDTTAGGDGAQRWSDDSTWTGGVENPITVAYNVIRGIAYGGEWFFGGQTVSAAQLPFAAWNAAQNECDAEIENEDASVEPQFRCAGEIRLDMEPADVIEDLLRACNGRPGETGGVYKPHVGAAGVAVLSITDDDVRTDEDQTFEPFLGLQDIVNAVNAKYIEPGEGWVAKDAPALTDAAFESEDGGRRQPVDLQFEYVPFSRQVQRQCRAALTDYRRERRHVLPLAPEAWRLEPSIDFVSWTSERNGYTDKLFSVEGVTDMDGYLVGVTLKEVDPGDYDDVTSVPPTIAPTPQVYPPSQGIAGADIDGVTVEGAGGRSKAGALLQWNGSDLDDVRAVAFQIRVDGETDLTYEGETPESAVAAGTYIVTANLNGATDYEGRLKFVPFTGRDTTWSDWIAFTTPDVRITWPEIDEATQAGLTAMAAQLKVARDLVEQVTASQQALEQAVLDGAAVQVKKLESVRGSARAELSDVQIALASADAALTVRMDTAESAIDDNTASIETLETTKVDAAGATAAAETVIEARFGVEDAPGSIEASVSTVAGAVADANSAIAALELATEASIDDLSAGGLLRFAQVVSPPTGATSGVQMLVEASDDGGFAVAGIKAYAVAGGGGSPDGFVSLVGDRIYREPSSGGDPVLMVDSQGRFVGDAIGSGQITLYKEYTRAEPGSDGAVGSGTTASNAGNTYIDSSSLGTLTVPQNPDAIGDGATASDYCPVLFAVNATARNNSFGWGFGSALAMVVAFRVKLDDGAGNVFYSDEGLIACSSGWAPGAGANAYGFGGNPGSITDISQVKAGTYNVYLQYRWGPRTDNGMAANPTAPNGLPLRIGAKIVALILKR